MTKIKTILTAFRLPQDVVEWLHNKRKKSKRTLSGEAIYQFYRMMGK